MKSKIYTLTINPSIDMHYYVESKVNIEGIKTVANEFQDNLGGKGINAGIVLNRQGYETEVITVANKTDAKSYVEKIENYNDMNFNLVNIDSKIRRNIKVHNEATNLETEINGLGNIPSEKVLQEAYALIENIDVNDHILVMGSLPTKDNTIYKDICKLLNKNNIPFSLDVGGFLSEELLVYKPLIVKPNVKELEEFFKVEINNEKDIIVYAKKMIEMGAQNVIVSDGSKGSYLIDADKVFYSKGLTVNFINSIGCGDTMIATFVATYLKTKDKMEAYKVACGASAATAESNGLATLDNILKLTKLITVKEVT